MKKEDIEFLNELKNEMLSQGETWQPDPHFWTVMQEVKNYNIQNGDEDDIEIIKDGEKVCEGNLENINEWLKEFIKDNDIETKEYIYYKNGHFINITFLEGNSYIIENAEDLISVLNDIGYDDYSFVTYKIREEIVPNTLFLTKKECENHIKANGYHYTNPKPCAMTAWRSPQVKKLFDIIKNTDWNEKVDMGEE